MNDYLTPFFQQCKESDFVFYKVLSQNDRSWAWPKGAEGYAHQGGIVIPDEYTRIFPRIEIETERGAHLVGDDRRYFRIWTYWLGDDGEWAERYEGKDWKRQSKFGRSYKDRGEFRVTGGLPIDHFRHLNPGSLFACARRYGSTIGKEYAFYCLTIDAQSDAYDEFIQTLLIPDPPWSGILDLATFTPPPETTVNSSDVALVAELFATPPDILQPPALILTAQELARTAVRNYEAKHDLVMLDLLRSTAEPGNEIQHLMEEGFEIVKAQQQRIYPAKVATVLWKSLEGQPMSLEAVVQSITNSFEEVRGVFKSMQNSIFSLAGSCFQHYVDLWLTACEIPHDSQKKVDGDRIPDFILPSVEYYWSEKRGRDDAVLLAAKTSCKERWQQILAEGRRVDTRYLATLDHRVPRGKLGRMQADHVILIVPESHKKTLEHYKSATNVLDYASFRKTLVNFSKTHWID